MIPEPIYSEAPASWNTSYITPDGFVCRITLRGDTGKDLLEKAGVAISYLMEHGYQPERNTHRRETKRCPIHHCQMKSYQRDGKSWFSHKLEDGSWCNGGKKQVLP